MAWRVLYPSATDLVTDVQRDKTAASFPRELAGEFRQLRILLQDLRELSGITSTSQPLDA